MLARNILLFTLLFDGTTSDVILRSIMYQFYVDDETLAIIRAQSTKLASLSENLSTWSKGPYARCLRLVNSETAETLKRFWHLYSGNDYSTPSFLASYNEAIKRRHSAINCPEGASVFTVNHEGFWAAIGRHHGFGSNCNPLFAYSGVAGTRFAVDKDSNPVAGFHLAATYAEIVRDYEFNPTSERNSRPPSEFPANPSFRVQFKASCDSFKRLFNSDPQRLQIRVFLGDAISFCMGLRQLREPGYIANCYSRPGSVRPLVLDGENHSGYHTPTKFNVIETGYLIDRVGLLTLLPNVIDALQGSTSVLYTSTRVETPTDEAKLMEDLLCGDVSVMCALLGVVPSAYLCGHAFQPIEDYLDLRSVADRPLANRIVWVPTMSTDPRVDPARSSIRCDDDEMVKFLSNIYGNMFSYDMDRTSSTAHWYKYNRRSFVELLAFFGRRIYAEWIVLPAFIMDTLMRGEHTGVHKLVCQWRHEYLFQANLLGLDATDDESYQDDGIVFVITVPRSNLQPLLSVSVPAINTFEMYVQPRRTDGNADHRCISSVQYCFGKLNSTNSDTTLDEDIAGWEGTSDLHVWGYVTRAMIAWDKAEELEVGVILRVARDVTVSIVNIICTRQDYQGLRILQAPPNLNRPSITKPPFDTLIYRQKRVARSLWERSARVKFPLLNIDKQQFTSRIDLTGNVLACLQTESISVSVTQPSTCVLEVKFGAFQIQCDYPFPVDFATTKLDVSRAEGWIEVTAPLLTPTRRGRFISNPFPVVASRPHSHITNCISPYINFRQLPPLDHRRVFADHSGPVTGLPSVSGHLTVTMFTNKDRTGLGLTEAAKFKLQIGLLLFPHPTHASVALCLESQGDIKIVFFVLGLYLDFNSRSIAREAYMLPMTSGAPRLTPDQRISATAEHLKCWSETLPSMVESARTWEHTANCEYKMEGIPRKGPIPICSCGKGKVGQEFRDVVKWRQFSGLVTRVAIQPIFPVPWLEAPRPIITAAADNGGRKTQNTPSTNPATNNEGTATKPMPNVCKVCSKEVAGKMCGKCKLVAYCSRECQAKDWKEHKKVCGLKTKARIG